MQFTKEILSQGNPSGTKNQPKEEVFGPDIPWTSGGHSCGNPGPKLRSGPSKPWENKHFGANIHDPKVRTSTTPRDFQKLRSEKLWAEFSFPNPNNQGKEGQGFAAGEAQNPAIFLLGNGCEHAHVVTLSFTVSRGNAQGRFYKRVHGSVRFGASNWQAILVQNYCVFPG